MLKHLWLRILVALVTWMVLLVLLWALGMLS